MEPITLVCGMSGGGTRMAVQLLSDLGIDFGPRLDYSGEDSVLKWPVVEAARSVGWDKCLQEKSKIEMVVNRLDFPTTERATGFKTPAQTVVLPVMRAIFPEIRVVHVSRHPVPLCFKERPFRTLRRKKPFDVKKSHIATAKEYAMVHDRAVRWFDDNNVRWHLLRVEDLASNMTDEVEKLAKFLGVVPVEPSLQVDAKRLVKNASRISSEVVKEIWQQAGPVASQHFHYDIDDYKLGATDD